MFGSWNGHQFFFVKRQHLLRSLELMLYLDLITLSARHTCLDSNSRWNRTVLDQVRMILHECAFLSEPCIKRNISWQCQCQVLYIFTSKKHIKTLGHSTCALLPGEIPSPETNIFANLKMAAFWRLSTFPYWDGLGTSWKRFHGARLFDWGRGVRCVFFFCVGGWVGSVGDREKLRKKKAKPQFDWFLLKSDEYLFGLFVCLFICLFICLFVCLVSLVWERAWPYWALLEGSYMPSCQLRYHTVTWYQAWYIVIWIDSVSFVRKHVLFLVVMEFTNINAFRLYFNWLFYDDVIWKYELHKYSPKKTVGEWRRRWGRWYAIPQYRPSTPENAHDTEERKPHQNYWATHVGSDSDTCNVTKVCCELGLSGHWSHFAITL